MTLPRAQNLYVFLLLGILSCAVESGTSKNRGKEPPIFRTYDGDTTNGDDVYHSSAQSDFGMAPYYERGPQMTDESRETENSLLFPSTARDFPAISPNWFLRNRRKHGRPLFYLNCSHRSQCHCYSKAAGHHYCCSCEVGACFPAEALLTTPHGDSIPMNKLRTGDEIIVASENGSAVSSKVLGFLDRRPFETVDYLTIETTSGKNLTLSSNHILLRSNSTPSKPIMDFAQNLAVGDSVYLMDKNTPQETFVTAITHELQKGAFVPLTEEGTLLVNGFVTSCYASFPHDLSHFFLAPARNFPFLLRFRLSGKPHQTIGDFDPAEDEGYGEAAYTTLVKSIGASFFKNQRATSDVLQLRTDPKEQLVWNVPPIFTTGVWMNYLAKLLGISSLMI